MHNIHAYVLLCNERNITVCCKFPQLHPHQIVLKSDLVISLVKTKKVNFFETQCILLYYNIAIILLCNCVSDYLGQGGPWNFSFEVKFYPVDPTLLREELTRYLYFAKRHVNNTIQYNTIPAPGTVNAVSESVVMMMMMMMMIIIITRNTLDCDQSNVYSSRDIFWSISPNLPLCSFSLCFRSASDPVLRNK